MQNVKTKGAKVLIVEDNHFNILPIKNTLNRNRIKFDWAKNGLMAVDRYTQAMKDS
jgi:CheY-like chemotaxis protein